MTDSTEIFENHRPALMALAYRMLGEVSRAEDVVQDAWLRWNRGERASSSPVASPRAFLLTTVARLCLDELGTARARREELREQLPEPIADDDFLRLERLDQVSMAFLVLLQRLSPAERAVFLLHDVFDMEHRDIGDRLGKTEPACRQLLKRAREHVATERKVLETSPDEHRRLFLAFVHALATGDVTSLEALLTEDAVLIVDPGEATTYGRMRKLDAPIVGARRIASIVQGFLSQAETEQVAYAARDINGEPGMVTLVDGRVTSAVTIAVADGKIRHIFVQYDARRLARLS